MKKVAIYCRLSDEDKNKEGTYDSESIKNQKKLLTNYALENEWDIYKIYSDDDWSGLDALRPDWNKMINDAETKKFEIILCKSQSRFTRDMEVVEKYLHKLFPIWGIRFIGYTDYADTDNKGNKKQRQINGLVNEWYCEDLSENIRVVFDKKRKDGQFIGSMASYGFVKDPLNKGRLIVDEEAALIVKRIFDLYIEGYGSSKIAKIFNEEGIPNPTKYKNLNGIKWKNGNAKNDMGLWNRTTIKRILKNQMYIGNMVQGINKKVSYKSKKQISMPKDKWFIVKNTHDAIISEDIFKTVQLMISNRRRSNGSGKPHVLSGKVKCADCGSTLSRITPHSKDGKTFSYKYLRCSMSEKKNSLCKGHYIRLDKLEDIILERMKNYLKDVNEKLIEESLGGIKSKNQNSIKNLQIKINDVERELLNKKKIIETLYIDRVNENISLKQFNDLSESFRNQINILEKRRELIMYDVKSKIESQINDDVNKLKKYKYIDSLTPRLINEFIDSITVGEKNKETGEQIININWNY
ncbi:recombinase family protein [Anaerovorax odorimutans]|uniref:recombinase family protein n=1 Tax=Anaerovorax odorimutans TaxID=109327 RepID=UPI000422A8C7|nr:recombinase family protein [Anaerovorax odorimutans]